jgi:hypothetical protein
MVAGKFSRFSVVYEPNFLLFLLVFFKEKIYGKGTQQLKSRDLKK